eukprot:3780974-Alexandrium_andersonii.AAC.1
MRSPSTCLNVNGIRREKQNQSPALRADSGGRRRSYCALHPKAGRTPCRLTPEARATEAWKAR